MQIRRSGIILWGDSVFFGYGASNRNKGCARLLKRKLADRPVIIKAKNLVTSRDALKNIMADVLSTDREMFNTTVMLFGNNDARLIGKDLPIVSVEEYKNIIIEIVNILKKDGRICYLANLQPLDETKAVKTATESVGYMSTIKSPYLWHKQYSDACSEIAKTANIMLVDIRTPLEKSSRDIFFDDGMHPNDEGHAMICETIYRALHGNR